MLHWPHILGTSIEAKIAPALRDIAAHGLPMAALVPVLRKTPALRKKFFETVEAAAAKAAAAQAATAMIDEALEEEEDVPDNDDGDVAPDTDGDADSGSVPGLGAAPARAAQRLGKRRLLRQLMRRQPAAHAAADAADAADAVGTAADG